MSRRVYLHVGAPKTGTTYLQDRLQLNARTLAAHGLHFPSGSPRVAAPLFHFRAALDLLGQDWGGPAGHADGSWEALVRRVRRRSGSVVVSHEILAPAPADAIARAKYDLGGSTGSTEVHVVYTVRDLARQIPAAWQESIKQGRTWPYRRFLDRVEHGKPWFYRALDLPSVLSAWSEGVPPEHVHVVTVPPAGSGKDVLWHRFLEALGADPAWAPHDSSNLNRSLGVAETTVIRKLNRRMKRAARREAPLDRLIREMLAQDTLVRGGAAPVLLPRRALPWAEAETERWVEWLKGSGVHVVGDLDDLRPLPIPHGQRYINPDKVSTKRQLKVSLDALSAMTREAARRPDPDRQLVARARTAARRLPR